MPTVELESEGELVGIFPQRWARPLRTTLAAMLAMLAITPDAQALQFDTDGKPVIFDITNALILDLHTILDDAAYEPRPTDVVVIRNKLNLRVKWDFLTAGARLDLTIYPNPPGADRYGDSLYVNDVRPEDLFLKFRYKRLTVTLGDDYIQLGRGMALSLRKIDALGFDVNVRGLHAGWSNKYFNFKFATGLTNISNVDGVTGKFVPDPLDAVFAARVEVRPVKWMRIGLNGVDIERRHSPLTSSLGWLTDAGLTDDNNPQGVRTWVTGGSLQVENIADILNFYVEANYQQTTNNRLGAQGATEDVEDGLAIYAEATLFAGPVSILVEAKHYRNWDIRSSPHPDTYGRRGIIDQTFPYVVPPTLERFDQDVTNNTNVTGAHLRIDYKLPVGNNVLFLSGAFLSDAPIEDDWTLHTYLGWEHKTKRGDRWVIQAGYRQEQAPLLEEPLTRLRQFHWDIDFYLLVDGPHDVQIHWAHEFKTKDEGTSLEDNYAEGTAYVSWNWAPHWSLTVQFEYANDAASVGKGNKFWGGYLQYKFTDSSFIRLFGGAQRGGLKCTGGVCRIFPEFEGVKLEATLRL